MLRRSEHKMYLFKFARKRGERGFSIIGPNEERTPDLLRVKQT